MQAIHGYSLTYAIVNSPSSSGTVHASVRSLLFFVIQCNGHLFQNTIMSKQSRKCVLTIKIPSANEPHLYINSQQYISPIHLSVVSHYQGGVPVN